MASKSDALVLLLLLLLLLLGSSARMEFDRAKFLLDGARLALELEGRRSASG